MKINNREPNAYRVVKNEDVHFYETDPNLLENIYGRDFVDSNGDVCNTCKYDLNKKYLHFFSDLNDAKEYLYAHSGLENYSILKFYFDPNLLALFEFKGKYRNPLDGKINMKKEYILPLPESYDAAENFIGSVSEFELSNTRVDYDPDYYGPF